jgi:hypothetical protein
VTSPSESELLARQSIQCALAALTQPEARDHIDQAIGVLADQAVQEAWSEATPAPRRRMQSLASGEPESKRPWWKLW